MQLLILMKFRNDDASSKNLTLDGETMSVVANAINPVLTLDRMVETSIVNTLEEKKLLSILLLRIIVKRLA